MIRARFIFAATLVGASLAAGSASAQAPAAPDFKPPVRGVADVEFSKPPVRRQGDLVVDEFKVKNMSSQPIARLTIESIYYEKGGAVIAGGKGFVNGLLQPGEVQTVKVETQYNPKMNSSNYKFTHANGPVTPKKVDKLENPDAPPAKKTVAKK